MIAGNITKEKLIDLSQLADIVDVSGALETNKVKDINKIKKFTAEIKKINYENLTTELKINNLVTSFEYLNQNFLTFVYLLPLQWLEMIR